MAENIMPHYLQDIRNKLTKREVMNSEGAITDRYPSMCKSSGLVHLVVLGKSVHCEASV